MADPGKRKRATPPGGEPLAKRAALALDDRQKERVLGDVRSLYRHYNALIDSSTGDAQQEAFQALLDAAQGKARRRRRLLCAAAFLL